MRILVLVKQVPDREQSFTVDAATKTIVESGLDFIINDFDRYAIEEALKLKEATSGEVTVLSVGPDRVQEALRKAMAMGADNAVQVNDPALKGSDAWGLSKAISQAVNKLGGFDLILAGITSEDDNHTATGVLVAERLGLPHATLVVKTEVLDGGARLQVERELEGGVMEPLSLGLPALLTIQTGINEPRYPTLPGIRKAQRKEIQQLGLADLGVRQGEVGAAGRQTEVLDLYVPAKRSEARIIEGDTESAVAELVRVLREEEKVL